jgi:hypothetical protein
MKAPLAIVTMVYNEPEFLPVWCRHYARQAGPANCYVVDHGSSDGSVDRIGEVNRIRLPRSPQDDERRAQAISSICTGLLSYYDAVIYVDVDEILVADPALYPSLRDFAAQTQGDAVVATGLDVIHAIETEAPIDWSRPVSTQRRWLRFSSAMCKPALIRRPVAWAPGFHSVNIPSVFGSPLFLFHLRYADLDSGLVRLGRTRRQAWSSEYLGQHQRMGDQNWASMLSGMAHLPQINDTSLAEGDPQLADWRDRVRASMVGREHERYTLDLHLSGDALWRLPDRFVNTF